MSVINPKCWPQRWRHSARSLFFPTLHAPRLRKSVSLSSLTALCFASAWQSCKQMRRATQACALLLASSMMFGCASTTPPQAIALPPLSQAAQTACNPPPKLQANPSERDALALSGGLALDLRECELRRKEAAEAYEAARAAMKGNVK